MECEFKFIQQWRAKLLFHIEQQLNISKTLRSAFPNYRTTTSVFCTQELALIMRIYSKETMSSEFVGFIQEAYQSLKFALSRNINWLDNLEGIW